MFKNHPKGLLAAALSNMGERFGYAAEGAHAHADEGQTDGHNHGAGDDCGEQLTQGLQEGTQHGLKQAAYNRRAHHGTVSQDAAAHAVGHALEDTDKAGAGAHDDGDLTAHGADGEQLDQGDQTGHQHGVLEQRDLNGRKLLCAAAGGTGVGDDQDGGQIAHKHGQNVLEAQRNGLPQRQTALKVSGGRIIFLFHTFKPSLFTLSVFHTHKKIGGPHFAPAKSNLQIITNSSPAFNLNFAFYLLFFALNTVEHTVGAVPLYRNAGIEGGQKVLHLLRPRPGGLQTAGQPAIFHTQEPVTPPQSQSRVVHDHQCPLVPLPGQSLDLLKEQAAVLVVQGAVGLVQQENCRILGCDPGQLDHLALSLAEGAAVPVPQTGDIQLLGGSSAQLHILPGGAGENTSVGTAAHGDDLPRPQTPGQLDALGHQGHQSRPRS